MSTIEAKSFAGFVMLLRVVWGILQMGRTGISLHFL